MEPYWVHVWLASRHPNHEHAACLSCSFHIQKYNYLEHNQGWKNQQNLMFIHFQLQWIGCNQTWHHDAAAPCNWIALRLLENRWTLQPGRMARHLDAMGCTRCYMANGQMVRHDAQNLHMLHNICYSVLGRSDSELVSVVSVLRLAKQIFCLRISFGVSIRYCPACRCDSLRLDTLTCQTQLVSLSCLSTQKTQPGALYRVLPSQSWDRLCKVERIIQEGATTCNTQSLRVVVYWHWLISHT